jgi:hypothetical protein
MMGLVAPATLTFPPPEPHRSESTRVHSLHLLLTMVNLWCTPDMAVHLMPHVALFGRSSGISNSDYVWKKVVTDWFTRWKSDEPGQEGVWTETWKIHRVKVCSQSQRREVALIRYPLAN